MDQQTKIGIGAAAGIALLSILEPHFFETHPILTGIIYAILIGLMAWGFIPVVISSVPDNVRKAPMLVLIGTGLIIGGGVIGLVGAMRMDAAEEAALHPPLGPLQVTFEDFALSFDEPIELDGILWKPGYARSEVILKNLFDEDFEQVDAIFEPEFPIVNSVATAVPDYVKCHIGPTIPFVSPMVLGHAADGSSKPVATPTGDNIIISSSHRLYCEKITPRTVVRVILAMVIPKTAIIKQPKFLNVQLRYKFRNEVHNEAFRLFY